MNTCQLHCTPVSVTRVIAAFHLDCMPEYLSATKYTKTSVSYTVTWYISNPGFSGLSLEMYTRISVRNKVYEDQCQLHCTSMYQSVTWGVHLECIDPSATNDLSATLFPGVSVSNPGYNGLLPGMFLEYRSATKYMKNCQILCTTEYHSMYQSIMQGMEGLEFMLEYQHIYKYGHKHCYLWKVMFSDDCLKK